MWGGMKLEVGKFYQDSAGRCVAIVYHNECLSVPFRGMKDGDDVLTSYHKNGKSEFALADDLVCEWKDSRGLKYWAEYAPEKTHKKWEYMESMYEISQKRGHLGWELVTVTASGVWIFKRELL
jgi:hypothetical protein